VDRVPPGGGRFGGEAVAGYRGDHHVEGVLGRSAIVGGVGEWADDVEHLDDRAGPAMGDEQRQGTLVGGADVEEVDVQPVDLGHELGDGVESGLESAQVVAVGPVACQRLDGGQLHALRLIADGLGLGPAGGLHAAAQLHQLLLRNLDREGADFCHGCHTTHLLGSGEHALVAGGVHGPGACPRAAGPAATSAAGNWTHLPEGSKRIGMTVPPGVAVSRRPDTPSHRDGALRSGRRRARSTGRCRLVGPRRPCRRHTPIRSASPPIRSGRASPPLRVTGGLLATRMVRIVHRRRHRHVTTLPGGRSASAPDPPISPDRRGG
jgi:hypothetical protein